MKIIHYLNILVYSIFLLLITGSYLLTNKNDKYQWFIIMFHIVLGIVQPFLALIISAKLDWSNKMKMKHIGRYWASVILFFILAYGLASLELELMLKTITVVPFCIATYFLFVTYTYQKK